MNKKRVRTIVIILIAAFVAFAVFAFVSHRQSSAEADKVISSMEEIVPYFGTDQHLTGLGREDLAMMTINGIDVVGAIEIPSINLRAPVTAPGISKAYFATLVSGSPTKGQMRITGDDDDVFRNLSDGALGEKVTFIDVDGIGYDYTITTQFHLKNWDKTDYDLLLTYQTDGDTEFVLGCMASE